MSTSSQSQRGFPKSARMIFRSIAEFGPRTRPALADELELSKPTVSDSVALLEARELIETSGKTQGHAGRTASRYQISSRAGCTIGIDAGSTHVRIRADKLDGATIYENSQAVSKRQQHINRNTVSCVRDLITRTVENVPSPVLALTLAVPTSVSSVFREQPDRWALNELQRALECDFGTDTDLSIENNVNCAAVGEQCYGAGQDYPSFVYLQLGVKIGLGIVYKTQLLEGANHAAGEPARIPFAWTPDTPPAPGLLEQYLGATSFMRRVRQRWPTGSRAPKDAADLFSRAERGNIPALRMVNEHAEDVGRVLAAIVAILDPGLVILGGGIGQNRLLRRGAQESLRKLAWPTEVQSTLLGGQATVLGAAARARARALDCIM